MMAGHQFLDVAEHRSLFAYVSEGQVLGDERFLERGEIAGCSSNALISLAKANNLPSQ